MDHPTEYNWDIQQQLDTERELGYNQCEVRQLEKQSKISRAVLLSTTVVAITIMGAASYDSVLAYSTVAVGMLQILINLYIMSVIDG